MRRLEVSPAILCMPSVARKWLAAVLTVGLGLFGHQAALSSSNHTNPDVHQASSLLADLSSQDPSVVSRAISKLKDVSISAGDALPQLIEATRNPSEFVRLGAINAIASYGPQAGPAIPALTKALQDADPLVREAATLGLLAVGAAAKNQAQRVIPLLQDEHKNIRDAAIAVFAGFGDDTIPLLMKALEGETSSASAAASEALARIGTPAVEPLVGALKKGGSASNNAAKALVAIGKPAVQPLIKLLRDPNPAVSRKAEEVLISIGTPSTEALIEALRSKP